jgi:hypothetical protein
MAQSKIKVFNPSDVLAALEKDAPSTLKIELKKNKDGKTYKGGVEYLQAKFVVGADNARGLVRLQDITVTADIREPADDEEERKGTNIETDLASSGVLGKMMVALNTEYMRQVNALITEGKFVPGLNLVRPMIQTHYSNKCPIAELKGKKIQKNGVDSPKIRMSLDFSTYPDTFPIKEFRGLPKTVVYDFRTGKVDANGRIVYEVAKVNGMPVNDSNVHEFIKRGSVIRDGRLSLDTLSSSNFGVSFKKIATKLVVEPATPISYDDEEQPDEKLLARLKEFAVAGKDQGSQPVKAPETPKEPAKDVAALNAEAEAFLDQV